MIKIQMDRFNYEVDEVPTPAGLVRVLVCTDPQSGLQIVLPFDENSARAVAAQLTGKPAIQVANGMPQMPSR